MMQESSTTASHTPNNFITIDKGEADGIRPEMGVVCGNGVVGIVYLTEASCHCTARIKFQKQHQL